MVEWLKFLNTAFVMQKINYGFMGSDMYAHYVIDLWFVQYCDYVTLRQTKQIFKTTVLSKPLGGATQRHLRQCCSYLLGFWLKWIRILVLINKEIIITIHHKVQQDQTFSSTNILFWWREKLLKNMTTSEITPPSWHDWNVVLAMHLPPKQLCLVRLHFTVWWMWNS